MSYHGVGGEERLTPNSTSKDCSQSNLTVELAIALYSLLVEDWAIMGCFLTIQDIKELPK